MMGVVFILSGFVVFLISLPLVYRKVPMNRLYGIRIRAAFESDQRWYDINAYGGRQLARWSWLIIAAGGTGFAIPDEHFHLYSLAGLGVVIVATLAPVVQVIAWSRRNAASNEG